MAGSKANGIRKRKRKARTEVSPSSASSESGHESATVQINVGAVPHEHTVADVSDVTGTEDYDEDDRSVSSEPVFTKKVESTSNPEIAFAEFYLRRATKEFANDLDKLRSAGDFYGTKSVAMLVDALKQGISCFGRDERVRVGRSVSAIAGSGDLE
ncbi:hypothetical protein BAUCODRAFT_119775 [Baudoinia panamericana UAMH 10762]|uniref:Ribosome assembly protein 3 n=1 Tax=Baudoinia panamericana (strain UAMH 10762) TaxID=717646 RepID=M2N7Y6_BAUPA|nr:uncharacterized protein BAUCODRAFT_119775 [Baudoinia panamericana UAMH 10762]EMD00224.1 hypothetical protein BAUCODRAFT_119775 [Baudoinia panamericana UAMH 10762]